MPRPCSLDLRMRVLREVEAGITYRIFRTFGIDGFF